MPEFPVPAKLAEAAGRDSELRGRLADLPAVVADAASRWSLRIGAPFQPGGQCSWVAPAGADLVVKVVFRGGTGEDRDEAAGLQHWNGNGVVRLQAVHDGAAARVLLLERCRPGTRLSLALPEREQDKIVAGLLRRLWVTVPAAHAFRPLADMCEQWALEFERDYAAANPAGRLDPGLARTGADLLRTLPQTAGRQALLCTDLHADNVLAARREPWLVIDPKPYVGDPAYDVVQHMLNCDRLASDPAGLAQRMAELTGEDSSRVRLWLFARCVQESVGCPDLALAARRLAPG
ncbi:MAG TPA: aminoglycoside phosphotransferase family protein [Streptosporangiaceae bacterium]|jgi:streptomycin 6-kinase